MSRFTCSPIAPLRIVTPDEPEKPEDALVRIMPQLLAAEAEVARFRNELDVERRRLAVKRGVAFIRAEAVRREFGGCSRQ